MTGTCTAPKNRMELFGERCGAPATVRTRFGQRCASCFELDERDRQDPNSLGGVLADAVSRKAPVMRPCKLCKKDTEHALCVQCKRPALHCLDCGTHTYTTASKAHN